MTKNETPPGSDSKPPAGKFLYDQSVLGGSRDADNKSRQHSELLAFFDALTEPQRSDILQNLHAGECPNAEVQ